MENDNTPIDPQNYAYGLNVVDIGDLRVARGMSRRPYSACNHLNMVFDQHERRIYCRDCEQAIEPFDAFVTLVSRYNASLENLARRREAVQEAESHALISRASKVMDKAWRRRDYVPCCPHCLVAIFPEDVLGNRLPRASKRLSAQRRRFTKKKK